MRIVTMIKSLRPFMAGDPAVLPDEMAERLINDGEAKDSRPFPPPDVAPRVAVAAPVPSAKGRYMIRRRA